MMHKLYVQCEKPFMGNRHYERKGLAYCETHYHQVPSSFQFQSLFSKQNAFIPVILLKDPIRYILLQLFGNLCYVCNQVTQTDVFTALNKASN